MDESIMNDALDFLNDFYRIMYMNEFILYKRNLMTKNIQFKNKIGLLINDYFNLPDDYISVSKKGMIIEKTHYTLHKNMMDLTAKIQKKCYKEDKLGIDKNSNIITSFYEDTDYICEVYFIGQNKSDEYTEWVRNYSKEQVYIESEDYKLYGGDENKIVKKSNFSFFNLF